MQPENQQVPPVAPPQAAPQPVPQPVPVQPVTPEPPVARLAPQPAPLEQPPTPQPDPAYQEQQAAPTAAPEALGAVAVGEQIEGGFGYDPGDIDDEEEIDLSQPIDWQASEYIHQEKDAKWFILFGIVIAVFMAVAILLMQSWTFAILLAVIAVMVIVLAKRPPRVMDYSLSNEGLHIGETLHKYADFKSFGIIHDGEEYSVMLIPRQRFRPGITVYFPEELGEDIVDVLGSLMPMKDLHLDLVDRLVRKLRL